MFQKFVLGYERCLQITLSPKLLPSGLALVCSQETCLLPKNMLAYWPHAYLQCTFTSHYPLSWTCNIYLLPLHFCVMALSTWWSYNTHSRVWPPPHELVRMMIINHKSGIHMKQLPCSNVTYVAKTKKKKQQQKTNNETTS